MSKIWIPHHATDESNQATLITVLDRVEIFLCQIVVSGEDSKRQPIVLSYLHNVLIAAWNGDLDTCGASAVERFQMARERLVNTPDDILYLRGITGSGLKSMLSDLIQSGDNYNQFGGRVALNDLLNRLHALFVAACIEDLVGNILDLIRSAIMYGGDNLDTSTIYH